MNFQFKPPFEILLGKITDFEGRQLAAFNIIGGPNHAKVQEGTKLMQRAVHLLNVTDGISDEQIELLGMITLYRKLALDAGDATNLPYSNEDLKSFVRAILVDDHTLVKHITQDLKEANGKLVRVIEARESAAKRKKAVAVMPRR